MWLRRLAVVLVLSCIEFAGVAPAMADNAGGGKTDYGALITALTARVTALESTITAQQATITTLQTRLTAAESSLTTLQTTVGSIEASSVMALAPYLQVTGGANPKALLAGINLQLVNGLGSTQSKNGLGNLLIGYDERRGADDDESGSHYLVIGPRHNYSAYSGLVVGYNHTVSGLFASVSGGLYHLATGSYASVSGGSSNTASGVAASVSGGVANIASAEDASVSGGYSNTASGDGSSILGGYSLSATSLNQTIPALP